MQYRKMFLSTIFAALVVLTALTEQIRGEDLDLLGGGFGGKGKPVPKGCPPNKGEMLGICAELCPDEGCPGGELCCPNGCGHQCMKKVQTKQGHGCKLPKVVGPCKAEKPRFWYNSLSNMCESFTYGGCKGNKNNFLTMADCENECKVNDVCQLRTEYGDKQCTQNNTQRYAWSDKTRSCMSFTYQGCNGNANNFPDKMTCMNTCDTCTLPMVIGRCKGAFPRWFFNRDTQKCEEFIYGGCQGNRNNFLTQGECYQACRKDDCKWFCQKCKGGKKNLHKCKNCSHYLREDGAVCAACVKDNNSKFDSCFNCNDLIFGK